LYASHSAGLLPQPSFKFSNVTLIRHGLLGASPSQPTVAFTLESLEFYHQLRRRQGNFSIQAFIKALCAIQDITYTRMQRNQFSVALDVYLDILRHVQCHVNAAWGRGAGWRIRNACPPCGYKLPGEPTLVPDRLHAMDGNNSMKRVNASGHADERVFISDYLIPPTKVDAFRDDVRTRPGTVPGNVPPFGNETTVCTEHWTVANTVSEGTVDVFEQTGGFLSTCWHAIMETLAEMRRSGELAKYGLATLNELLEVFGHDQAIGYNIGCSHKTT
ncbi:hypothetical protein BJV78DRAFT_1087594, partial [Lactifluus subvellereus]